MFHSITLIENDVPPPPCRISSGTFIPTGDDLETMALI
jgi:hypothetical protein